MGHVTAALCVSQRRACRVLDQHRSTRRKARGTAGDEAALTRAIVELATRYGRCGTRRITALLHAEGWACDHERVERTWRAEGLKVPARQPRRGRPWLNDGACLRLRPERPGRPNHVRAYDFVEDRTREGRKSRTLSVVEPRGSPDVDEFSRECLAIRVGRRLGSAEATGVPTDLFVSRGTLGTLAEARVLIEQWRVHRNGAAARRAGLPATCTRGHPVEDASACSSARSGGISRGMGHDAEPGSRLDHPMGAGQPHLIGKGRSRARAF